MEAETGRRYCPLCEELGRTGTLVLCQINAQEAIYVCTRSDCPYPVGVVSPDVAMVTKPVPELLTENGNSIDSATNATTDTTSPGLSCPVVSAESSASTDLAADTASGTHDPAHNSHNHGAYLDSELDTLLTSLLEEI